MMEGLFLAMRWLHIVSMATLVGGMLFARFALVPALKAAPGASGAGVLNRAGEQFRPFVLAAIAALVISGVFNVLITPGHRTVYHIVLGVKLLLAGHVFASVLLIVRADNPRRVRLMTGAVISGLAIILISAWLRRHF
jgi:uncharacterized membrane protein